MNGIEKRKARADTENPQQWRVFVDEYCKDFSLKHAFLRTFGGGTLTAERNAKKLIQNNVWIRDEIKKRTKGRITLADITPERIQLELARLAFFDARKLVHTEVTEEGLKHTPIALPLLDNDTAAAIVGIEYSITGQQNFKISDKQKALHTLAAMQAATAEGVFKASTANMARDKHDALEQDEITALLDEHEEQQDDQEDDTIDMNEGDDDV